MKKFIQKIKGFFAKANVSSCKKWLTTILMNVKKCLPTFNAYQHNNGVSITPHFGYQWYKHTSKEGDMKAQIHLGWIMWSCQLMWKHNAQ